MKNLSIFLSILLLLVCACTKSHWIAISDITKWEDAPNIELIDKEVFYHPDIPGSYRSTWVAQIKLDVTFKNTSQKRMKSVTFEILLFCQKPETDSELKQVKVKPYTYLDDILSGENASFLYEPSVDGLTVPVKQIIRIAEIEYTDGSTWNWTDKK